MSQVQCTPIPDIYSSHFGKVAFFLNFFFLRTIFFKVKSPLGDLHSSGICSDRHLLIDLWTLSIEMACVER